MNVHADFDWMLELEQGREPACGDCAWVAHHDQHARVVIFEMHVIARHLDRSRRQQVGQGAGAAGEAALHTRQHRWGTGAGALLKPQAEHQLNRRVLWLRGTHGQGRIVVQLLAEALRASAFRRPARQIQLRQLHISQAAEAQPTAAELATQVIAAERELAVCGLAARLRLFAGAAAKDQSRPTGAGWSLGWYDHIESALQQRTLAGESLNERGVVVRQRRQLTVHQLPAALLQVAHVAAQVYRCGAHENLDGVAERIQVSRNAGPQSLLRDVVLVRARCDTHLEHRPVLPARQPDYAILDRLDPQLRRLHRSTFH